MSSINSSLSTVGLDIGYASEAPLLANLNLTLIPGKLVCFMGPNGIGKSTLIRTLAGLQHPLTGSITGVSEKNVSIVLTDRISSQYMTVQDLVAFGRYPYLAWNIQLSEEDLDIIARALRYVNMERLAHRKLYELSDGQVQMVMIARALAQQTPILLLDEPTAHLDLNNRVEIMNLLLRMCREEKKAILLATHELDLALQTADEIWLAARDQTIKTGVPEDLVLSGLFDTVFQFKGFDLKTGKIQHQPFRKKKIVLNGDGHALLWTRNALERNGYTIDPDGDSMVTLEVEHEKLKWRCHSNTGEAVYPSIEELLLGLAP